MKNFDILGVDWKIWLLGGEGGRGGGRGSSQKTYIEEGLPKKWGFDNLQIQDVGRGGRGGGIGKKKGSAVFEGGLIAQWSLWDTTERKNIDQKLLDEINVRFLHYFDAYENMSLENRNFNTHVICNIKDIELKVINHVLSLILWKTI